MKCAKCGAEITYDLGYCPYCGAEVRIVPDYNPLDDMLAEQVRDAIGGEKLQKMNWSVIARQYRRN